MFMQEFYSKLASSEQSPLFDALRKLRLLPDPKHMMANAEEDGGDAIVGWTVWGDASGGTGNLAHGAEAGV